MTSYKISRVVRTNHKGSAYIIAWTVLVAAAVAAWLFFDSYRRERERVVEDETKAIEAATSREEGSSKDNVAQNTMHDLPITLSIIIAELGLRSDMLQQAMSLPNFITLGFSPYAPNVEVLMEKARSAGHDVAIGIPMQLRHYPFADMGPYSLLDNFNNDENIARLQWVMSKAGQARAVYAPPDEIFTDASDDTTNFLKELEQLAKVRDSTLGFLYADVEGVKPVGRIANKLKLRKVETALIDVAINSEMSVQEITNALEYAMSIAYSRRHSILLVVGKPLFLKVLTDWLKSLESRPELKLLPINEMLQYIKDTGIADRVHDHTRDIQNVIQP